MPCAAVRRIDRCRFVELGLGLEDRQTHFELTAQSTTLAGCGDSAAVQLNQAAHECQTNAQTTARALAVFIDLREHLENSVELVRRHTDAAVSHQEDNLIFLALRGQPNDI